MYGQSKQGLQSAKAYIDVRQKYCYIPEHLELKILSRPLESLKLFLTYVKQRFLRWREWSLLYVLGQSKKIHKALALIKDKIYYPLEVHMLSKKKSPPKQGPISKP